MELQIIPDARLGKKNGVVRFSRAEISQRSKVRRRANGKEAAYQARADVREQKNLTSSIWRAANPEKVAATYRRWEEKKGPLGLLLHRARRGADRRGLEFSITAVDLLPLPSHCPVFGLELDYVGGAGRDPRAADKRARASVDRKDSRYGYVPGNVLVVSWRANTLKSDATPTELRQLADFYGRL